VTRNSLSALDILAVREIARVFHRASPVVKSREKKKT